MSNSVVALSRFQFIIGKVLNQRGKDLLVRDDLATHVPTLDALETYYVIKAVGLQDAAPILAHCTSAQLQTFIDLEGWSGDRPSLEDIDAWLGPYSSLGEESLVEAFLRLEEELQVWILRESLDIFEIDEEESMPDPREGRTRKTTLDRYFVIEADSETEQEVPPIFLVEALYKHDMNTGFRLLTAARWEHSSTLEEEALRFRTGRLEDLGFPPRDQALKLFAPPPTTPPQHPVVSSPTASNLPIPYAEAMAEETTLLARALRRINDPDTLHRIQQELLLTINHAVVALGTSFGSMARVAEVASHVRDTISLGLEVSIFPGNPNGDLTSSATIDEAVRLCSLWGPYFLFRRGHHAAVEMVSRLQPFLDDPVIVTWKDKHLTEQDDYGRERMDREFIHALHEKPPCWSGFDAVRPEKRRAFVTQADLVDAEHRAEQLVQRLT